MKVTHLKDLQPDIGSASLHRSRHVVLLDSGEGSRNLVKEVLEVGPDADISFGVSMMLTSISAIDTNGVGYCNITTTTNTTETFNAFFQCLIAFYDEAGLRCVLWVDNFRIHNQMKEIVVGSRHCVVFNTTYNPS